jgi:transitional endoplasmic reticulum ATPase
MPLASDVRLEEIAEHTHGFVGADLEALCQEVGMIALRRFLSKAASPADDMTAAQLDALQVTADDVLQGLRLVEPSATREFLIERPSVGFTSIGGLGDVKRLLRAIVTRARGHDELYEQTGLTPPRGILFTGPSGTGKTATARALAGETALPLIAVDGPRLFSKWLGESERAVRDVFKKARRAAPCLLFFDNIDALAPRLIDGGTDQPTGGVYPRVISQLLQEIDGVGDIDGVIVLAATSRLERVDPAVLRSGRFDYVLRFDLPDEPAREEIARIGCRQAPLDADVDLAELARRTAGHTGADIVSACKKAILVAIERYRRPDRPHDERFAIRRQDFEENLPS